MKEAYGTMRDFIATRNRLVATSESEGLERLLANYLSITANRLREYDCPELDCLRKNIESLSKADNKPITNETKAKLYPLIRLIINEIKLTRHQSLNRIIEAEVALLEDWLKAAASTATSYSIVNSADEFGATDALEKIKHQLGYLSGMMDVDSFRFWHEQIKTAGKALCDAIQCGFPSEEAKAYWAAIKPTISPESKEHSLGNCQVIEHCYKQWSRDLDKTIRKHAVAQYPTIDTAYAMILFANTRIGWMSTGEFGISPCKAIGTPEFKMLQSIIGAASCLLGEDAGADAERFDVVQELLDKVGKKIDKM